MYDIFKKRIENGGYQLTDIQHRMKKLFAQGDLTEEQLDELMAMSQQHASAEAERPETLQLILELADRISALEKQKADQDGAEEEQPKYEEWVQPVAGLTDKYQYGEILAHFGQLWLSIFKGQNVWEPGVPGTELMWVKYTPEEG